MFFALLLKPVAVEESEEIEQVLLGKKKHLLPEQVGLYRLLDVLNSKIICSL